VSREQWAEFTTARSEGLLKVDRSIRAEHPCRVRLLAFANPVTRAAMAAFQYGIMAVHPNFGFLTHQDLRRFDVVACVAEGDQRLEDIDQARMEAAADPLVPAHLLRESILWAWTRRFTDCHYAAGAEAAIMKMATALSQKLGTPEIPLLITDAPEKVARLAFAFASLLHSTNDRHEHVIVTPVHVGLVGRYLEAVYMHPNCAFDQYAAVLRRRAGLTDGEYRTIIGDLLTPGSNREDPLATESMLELFLTEDDIPRADLKAATGLGEDALSNRIGKLRKHHLIESGRRAYRKTPRFVDLLRRWALSRSNPPNPVSDGSTGGVS
jgi:hypothetical protein